MLWNFNTDIAYVIVAMNFSSLIGFSWKLTELYKVQKNPSINV